MVKNLRMVSINGPGNSNLSRRSRPGSVASKGTGGRGGWTKEHGYFGTRADTEICELSSDLTAGQNALFRLPRRPRRLLGRGAEPVRNLVSEDLKLLHWPVMAAATAAMCFAISQITNIYQPISWIGGRATGVDAQMRDMAAQIRVRRR